MFVSSEFNSLPLECTEEFDGYFFGRLSGSLPFGSEDAELLARAPKSEAEVAVECLQFRLFDSDYTFPQLTTEVFFEVQNLQEGSAAEAMDYLRRHGLVSLFDLRTPRLPAKIQSYWNDSYRNGSIPFAILAEHFWIHRRVLVDFARSSMYGGRRLEVANAHVRFSSMYNLRRVIVGVRVRNGTLMPTLASYGLADALALLVLDEIHRGTQLAECQNRKCGHVFVLTRAAKKYCSERCQALAKTNRARARLRQQKRISKRKLSHRLKKH